MSTKRHIFIGGLHRSGTSFLHEILKSHPAISGFSNTGVPEDEGQHLQSVYLPAKAFGGPGRFGFNSASYMDEGHPLATQENSDKLLVEWGRYWDLSKDFLVEKSPPNLVRTRFLQKLFPGSFFIIILRHPIAVAQATQKWSKTSICDLLEHSLLCYERFFKDAPYLDKVYVLRYEDLVQSPQEQVESLFGWIGINMHDFEVTVRKDDNEKYFSAWNSEKGILSAKGIHAETAEHEYRMNAYGYSFKEPMTINQVASTWPQNNSLRVRRP